MFNRILKISWETVGKFVLAVLGLVPVLVLLVNFLNSRSPQITIKNELAFPIRIYVREDLKGTISAYSRRTFKFYSEKDFPVEIEWEGIQQKLNTGEFIGDIVTGKIDYVDNHQTVVISHTTGRIDYFMPILSNETDMTCKIFVNDGLLSGKYAGVLLPQKQRINIGYYKWLGNSNVTLYCDDGPHWWGDRRKNLGPPLKVKSPSGEVHLKLSR